MSPVRMRTREPDEVCAASADVARAAAEEMAGRGHVGDHVGLEADGDRVVTHLFHCLDPAYRGWYWAITLARASRSKTASVSESVLLPGSDSILAPAWVPWRERLRPGDLGVGDIMPAAEDDERLVPTAALEGDDGPYDYAAGDTEAVSPPQPELPESAEAPGPADVSVPRQARVLSALGRDDAASRWYSSEHGPRSPLAHAAPGTCGGCGFYVRLSGPLGQVFGVCGNAFAPDDGRVTSADHGCGAHSEARMPSSLDPAIAPVIDELGYDLMDLPGVSVEETVFESLDPS